MSPPDATGATTPASPGPSLSLSQRAAGLSPWLLAALLGGVWGWFFLHYGMRLSGDSTAYAWYALQAHGAGELTVAPTWPPLYTLALAALMWITPFPSEASALLAGLCIFGLAGAVGSMARWAGSHWTVAAAVTLLVGTWPAVLQVYDVAWSEQLYGATFALHALFLARFWSGDRTRDLALAALFVSMLTLTRYAGYSQIGLFGLAGLWTVWRRPAHRLPRLAILALTPLPSALYVVRNLLVFETVHGERQPGVIPFSDNLATMLDILAHDLASLPSLAAAGGLVLLGVGLAMDRGGRKEQAAAGPPPQRDLLFVGAYLLVAVLSQIGLALYATSTVKMDALNPRFTAPLYPLLVGAGALGLGTLRRWRGGSWVGLAALLGLTWAQLPDTRAMFDLVEESLGSRQGHTGIGFSSSRTAAEIRSVVQTRLARADGLGMVSIVKARSGRNGRALFVRGAAFLTPSVSQARFTAGDVHHAVLELTVDGQRKEIRGISMPSLTRTSDLLPALERAWAYSSPHPLIVVVHPKGLQKELGHSRLEPLLAGKVVVRHFAEAPPFDFYEVGGFVQTDAAPQRATAREGELEEELGGDDVVGATDELEGE